LPVHFTVVTMFTAHVLKSIQFPNYMYMSYIITSLETYPTRKTQVSSFKFLFITRPMWATVLTRANTEHNKTKHIMDMYAIQEHTEQLYCY